ncbi:AP complex subunit sigma [Mycena sanguinolenta]|uniref:AP complex subunit sigma n=1 Tax=Mycena sanguinolenta TaxID=230812 RepID=A0A8H6Z8T9_9AGAR|nr:AP complex subunit sigma [Mycena sanguinolenta]
MIRFILVQVRPGQFSLRTRNWKLMHCLHRIDRAKRGYRNGMPPYEDDEKVRLRGEVHRLVSSRDQRYQSNFVEFRNYKIVYRRYAGLFFCVCVDANDNELAYLEAIHFFVEVLDNFFENVNELDLVFNFYKVYAILDEIFLAGEIQETSKDVVLLRLEELEKLE